MEDFYTTAEVMKLLAIKRPTLYQWVSSGKLTAYHRGGGKASFFKKADIDALLAIVPKKAGSGNETALTELLGKIEPGKSLEQTSLSKPIEERVLKAEQLILAGEANTENDLEALLVSVAQAELPALVKALYWLGYTRGSGNGKEKEA